MDMTVTGQGIVVAGVQNKCRAAESVVAFHPEYFIGKHTQNGAVVVAALFRDGEFPYSSITLYVRTRLGRLECVEGVGTELHDTDPTATEKR